MTITVEKNLLTRRNTWKKSDCGIVNVMVNRNTGRVWLHTGFTNGNVNESTTDDDLNITDDCDMYEIMTSDNLDNATLKNIAKDALTK